MIGGMAAPLEDLTHVIQLSVAPVFLLTSVATLLAVLTTRLGRLVDRTRVLNERLLTANEEQRTKALTELKTLIVRRHLVNQSITFGTITALLICVLIMMAFVGFLIDVRMSFIVALLFILAMMAFIISLLRFLKEVLLAAASVQIEGH